MHCPVNLSVYSISLRRCPGSSFAMLGGDFLAALRDGGDPALTSLEIVNLGDAVGAELGDALKSNTALTSPRPDGSPLE